VEVIAQLDGEDGQQPAREDVDHVVLAAEDQREGHDEGVEGQQRLDPHPPGALEEEPAEQHRVGGVERGHRRHRVHHLRVVRTVRPQPVDEGQVEEVQPAGARAGEVGDEVELVGGHPRRS